MKKQFTLIELIIVIVVIGILAAMAMPKFNGVVREAKLSAMINDKEVLEKTMILYYQKHDKLPLLNENQELIVLNNDISLVNLVQAEEAQNNDMTTIYKSLQETLNHYNDSEDNLYRIDIKELKDSLGKDIKYGHKKTDKDFYVYSMKTGNVYYYDYLVNGNGTIQHTEYDTLLKENELVNKKASPLLNKSNIVVDTGTPITIQNKTIALGSEYTIKIGEDGNLYAWGNNNNGQLGIGNTVNQLKPQSVILPNGEKPISIYSKMYHSMVITNKGNLYAWGLNDYGQLGIGNTINQTTPQLVTLPNGEKPISVSLSTHHSAVITNKGNLFAWGLNDYGQLGIGNTINQTIPQLVTLPNGEKPISITLGNINTSSITDKGNLYVWGGNTFGELGIGNKDNQEIPQIITIPNGEKPTSIQYGWLHLIVLTDKENLYVWGNNAYGQLGIGNIKNQSKLQLVTLPNGEKSKTIATGYYNSMVITNKGNVYAWGLNNSGQLGIKNETNQITPQLVTLPNGEKPTSIALGEKHSMIRTENNNFYSFGANAYGQLGLGNTTNQKTPIQVKLP